MTTQKKQALIGDLLVRAGLITSRDLINALQIGRENGLPIGNVLCVNGFVSEKELSSALRVQALVRDRLLPEDFGIDALTAIRGENISLEEALDRQGWQSDYHDFTNNLGKLMLDANCVTQPQLEQAMAACHTSGLPLGRILVLQGAISEYIAYATLTAQALLRDNKIARDQAVGALKLTTMHGDTIEDYLEFGGSRKIRPDHVLRLGEMFVLSELVNELDLLSAVEKGLAEAQPIGQVLLNHRLVDPQLLEVALRLQDLIRDQKMQPLDTIDVLKEYAETRKPLDEILKGSRRARPAPKTEGLSPEDKRLLETVHVFGFISETELGQICDEILSGSSQYRTLEQLLVGKTRVDEARIVTAMACRELVEAGALTLEQAIFAIHIWSWSGGEFDTVLKDIGWL